MKLKHWSARAALVGTGALALALGGVVFSPAPAAQAFGCSSLETYDTNNNRGAFSLCSNDTISVEHRAIVSCGDGSTRYGPWVSSVRQSVAWCPTGYAVTGHSSDWHTYV
jgi:hypothetical protein